MRSIITVAILLLLATWLAFYLGKNQGTNSITNIATNEILIKEIAELAALEVHGNAQINQTNVSDDGGLWTAFKKALNEQSISINIPYVAKYGIKADSLNMKIKMETDKTITIKVPEPQLLSMDFSLDKLTINSSEGWLKTQSFSSFNTVQKKLYIETKAKLAESKKNKDLAKEKIVAILKNYYEPLGVKVRVQFGNENSIFLFGN